MKASSVGPIVETAQGKLRGASSGGLSVFKGIPFAGPPLGSLRFRPPRQPAPWQGVRDALQFGRSAPQQLSEELAVLAAGVGEQSEDCLYLNVWTPGIGGARRPVMVWIHGGAFVIGSGSQTWYDGAHLASRGDSVIVTINYRLGALGFLYLDEATGGELAGSGNAGLLDQIAALRWVKENIASFGGDPENITIFGESAGAMSVSTLCGTPGAGGLFHRAIAQSGAAEMVRNPAEAGAITDIFLAELGLGQRPSPDDLAAAQVDQIMAAQGRTFAKLGSAMGADRRGQLAFEPVVDGDLLPRPPLEAIEAGDAADVAMLLGTNADEMRLFTLFDPAYQSIGEEQLVAQVGNVVESERAARALIDGYRRLGEAPGSAHAYSREGSRSMSPQELWSAMTTDWVFRMPAVRLAEAQLSHGAPVWAYLFTWPSPILEGALGACHALEVPFVWGSFDDPMTALLLGDGATTAALSAAMQDAWLAFARTGDPNSPRSPLPHWTTYDTAERKTMIFGKERRVESDPGGQERTLWSSVGAAR